MSRYHIVFAPDGETWIEDPTNYSDVNEAIYQATIFMATLHPMGKAKVISKETGRTIWQGKQIASKQVSRVSRGEGSGEMGIRWRL
jgi:hypothetical protein